MIVKRDLRFTCIFLVGVVCACSDDDTDRPRCELLPQQGPCEAAISKYYYDQQAKECKEFLWGGCEGVVPFDTLAACQDCIAN